MAFEDRSTKVVESTLVVVLLEKKVVRLKLGLEDSSERLIFNLVNMYYLPKSFCKLERLGFFNNSSIFYKNKYKNLSQITTKKILA